MQSHLFRQPAPQSADQVSVLSGIIVATSNRTSRMKPRCRCYRCLEADGDDNLPANEAAEGRRPDAWENARMAVGTLRRFVLDVNDLPAGERFWAAVTGLAPRFSAWQGQFSALGEIKSGSILLQLVPERKTTLKNRAHIDVTVEDLDRAVEEIIALGGAVVKPPGPFPEADPVLEWAVMADPFGNEFCLIRDLEPNE